jgi:hypothetical protein
LPIYGDSMGKTDLGTVDLELKADDLRMFNLIFSFLTLTEFGALEFF